MKIVKNIRVVRNADDVPSLHDGSYSSDQGEIFVQNALITRKWRRERVEFPIRARLIDSIGSKILVADSGWTAILLDLNHDVKVLDRDFAVKNTGKYTRGNTLVCIKGILPVYMQEIYNSERTKKEEVWKLHHVQKSGVTSYSTFSTPQELATLKTIINGIKEASQ